MVSILDTLLLLLYHRAIRQIYFDSMRHNPCCIQVQGCHIAGHLCTVGRDGGPAGAASAFHFTVARQQRHLDAALVTNTKCSYFSGDRQYPLQWSWSLAFTSLIGILQLQGAPTPRHSSSQHVHMEHSRSFLNNTFFQ